MTLGEKQRLFTKLVAKLILQAYYAGYELSFGQTYRTKEEALRNFNRGTGIKNSLHCSRLAVDLNLFRDGKFLRKTEHHACLGHWWKQQNSLCRWGGDFRKPDGGHYSIAHGNRA